MANPSLLAERDLTDAEREAVADVERPGVWVEDVRGIAVTHRGARGDGRTLTQHETDCLIVRELAERGRPFTKASYGEFLDIVEPWNHGVELAPAAYNAPNLNVRKPAVIRPEQQRGGLH